MYTAEKKQFLGYNGKRLANFEVLNLDYLDNNEEIDGYQIRLVTQPDIYSIPCSKKMRYIWNNIFIIILFYLFFLYPTPDQ